MKTIIVFCRVDCPPSDDAKKYFNKQRGRVGFQFREYDIDKNKELATKYEVYNTPTVIMLDDKQNVVKKLVGAVPFEEYNKLYSEPEEKAEKVEQPKEIENQCVTVELLAELVSANNKDFKFLLDQRDKGVKIEESLITAEAIQTITLVYLMNYCRGIITKEELFDALVEVEK